MLTYADDDLWCAALAPLHKLYIQVIADVSSRMLTYADVCCSRMLTYADVSC